MRNETVNNSNPSGRGREVEEDLANGFQLLVFLGACDQTMEHALVDLYGGYKHHFSFQLLSKMIQ